ncbi:MAG: SMI1/KNR4 family protein [Chloroflexi bacterium]|nr:MAG: SMI1/KNR4 family protein [Chloroflexota bacterium]
MAMKDMDAALQLVARNDRQADFVGKRSTEMVADAESALGVRFPPTYRKFLTELGAGDIAGEEFYTIPAADTWLTVTAVNGSVVDLMTQSGRVYHFDLTTKSYR